MFSKILLWFSALCYLAYGAMTLYDPSMQANFAGMTLNSGDAPIEIGAMYGGMSLALALFFMLGATQPWLTRASLLLLTLALGGLGLSRTALFALSSEPVTTYTLGAIGFELTLAVLAAIAFATESKRAAAQ